MSRELTDKQQLTLGFIKSSISCLGYPPTTREIGDHLGITVKAAWDHLKALERKGYVKTKNNTSRAIRVIDESEAVYKCPHCGNGIKEYKLN